MRASMANRPESKKEKVWLANFAGLPFNRAVNVFTYGSLMFDEVWRGVVGRPGVSVVGTLADHEAWKIAGEVYPGLYPAPGRQVAGRVWLDVGLDELARLDRFEPAIYERRTVVVRLPTGEPAECETYMIRTESRDCLLAEPWDREGFKRRHLASFLAP